MTMPMTAEAGRRFLAEEIRVSFNVRDPRLIDAVGSVPREQFLPPGPWLIRGLFDTGPRQTDDADPRHVYHDVAVAIDPSRTLYNGQPSLIVKWLESLEIREGEHVVHIGCGTGYFTAMIASVVGPGGRVSAMDIDADLAGRAQQNLTPWPWASVRAGDGRSDLPADADVVIVHAGATHLLDEWLDALRDGGRLLVPLTGSMPGMGPTIGKGTVITARRTGDEWSVKPGAMVAIYSLVGLRDATMEAKVGQAFLGGKWTAIRRIRRDRHAQVESCVLHGENCLSS